MLDRDRGWSAGLHLRKARQPIAGNRIKAQHPRQPRQPAHARTHDLAQRAQLPLVLPDLGPPQHWSIGSPARLRSCPHPAALLPPSSCCRPALLPVIAPTDRHTRALSHHVASFERCAAPLPCSTDPPHPNTPALTALPPRTRALHLSHTLASSSMGSACR